MRVAGSRIIALLCGALAPLSAALAQAPASEPARPFASPDVAASAPAGTVSGIGAVTLALFLVLAAVFAVAWLMRRLRGGSRGASGAIEVIAQTALGARERAVLVQVGGTRLLLGVAPGRVSALHVLPADAVLAPPSTDVPGSDGKPNFFALLQKSLGR